MRQLTEVMDNISSQPTNFATNQRQFYQAKKGEIKKSFLDQEEHIK